jgi:hypothetical protein
MMLADLGISTRYLRIATRYGRAWARQIGASRDGHLLVFSLVGTDGRDLGRVLVADDTGLELEPGVLLPDGLHPAAPGVVP